MPTIEAGGKEYSGDKLWREEAVLRELYVERRYSTTTCGEMLGCAAGTISDWLKRYGIEARDIEEAKALERRRAPAYFRTDQRGYEAWEHTYQGEKYHVYVHRLLAVAEYGFDAVAGNVVHHKHGIRWTNWGDAIELMDRSDHNSYHFKKVWGNEEHREMMREVGRRNEAEMPRAENGDFIEKR